MELAQNVELGSDPPREAAALYVAAPVPLADQSSVQTMTTVTTVLA